MNRSRNGRFGKARMLLVLAALAGLSASPSKPAGIVSNHSASRPGIVFVADGIGGMDALGKIGRQCWAACGVPHEIRTFRWSHGTCHWLQDLQDEHNILWKGQKLAAKVREAKAKDPDRPIYLVGRSGGAGIVLTAAAHLPPDTVERIVLLSPAVSPSYDLSAAFRATRAEIVCFCSCNDQVLLNLGTSLFGTVDRVYGPSAGLHGFILPGNEEKDRCDLYSRLVHVRWRPDMLCEAHPGLHVSALSPLFLRREVAPWLY
jgi:hypothetical protein